MVCQLDTVHQSDTHGVKDIDSLFGINGVHPVNIYPKRWCWTSLEPETDKTDADSNECV